jgi:hypothetical protein
MFRRKRLLGNLAFCFTREGRDKQAQDIDQRDGATREKRGPSKQVRATLAADTWHVKRLISPNVPA